MLLYFCADELTHRGQLRSLAPAPLVMSFMSVHHFCLRCLLNPLHSPSRESPPSWLLITSGSLDPVASPCRQREEESKRITLSFSPHNRLTVQLTCASHGDQPMRSRYIQPLVLWILISGARQQQEMGEHRRRGAKQKAGLNMWHERSTSSYTIPALIRSATSTPLPPSPALHKYHEDDEGSRETAVPTASKTYPAVADETLTFRLCVRIPVRCCLR